MSFFNRIWTNDCVLCGQPVEPDRESPLCRRCHVGWEAEKDGRRIERSGQPIAEFPHTYDTAQNGLALTMVLYEPSNRTSPASALIYRLKVNITRRVTDFAAGELADLLKRSAGLLFDGTIAKEDIMLTYIPRRRSTVKRIGYDHMKILSKAVAKRLGLRHMTLLRRAFFAKEQKHIGMAERIKNARRTIVAVKRIDVGGKTIVLLDDIITTGASLHAGSEALLDRGARMVICATIAEARRR